MIRRSDNEFHDICTFGLMTLTWASAENSLAMTIGSIPQTSSIRL